MTLSQKGKNATGPQHKIEGLPSDNRCNRGFVRFQQMMTLSQIIVTPVKTGVQTFRNYPKTLDSGFRRNDEISRVLAFCEADK